MELSEIKKEFFSLRNGMIADTLRKAGMPYKMIFGLNVPQLAEIARRLVPSEPLAESLWRDREVRESRLLATYLFPPEQMSLQKALQLAADIRTPEEGDMLAFRIFKRLPFAQQLLEAMEADAEIPASAAKSLRNHLE